MSYANKGKIATNTKTGNIGLVVSEFNNAKSQHIVEVIVIGSGKAYWKNAVIGE